MSTHPSYSPSDHRALQAFQADGVVCLRGAIDSDWLKRLQGGVSQACDSPGPNHFKFGEPGQAGAFFGDVMLWQRHKVFEEFAFEGPLADIAGALMESRTVTFYHDFLLVKGSGSNKTTPWHQDQSYWCFEGNQALTIWAPLDPVSMANTLEFAKGSHLRSPVFEAVPFDKKSTFDGTRDSRLPVPDMEATREEHTILSWELQPGDCLIFHCRMLHAAPGNPLPHSRRVLSTCWAGDDVRVIDVKSDLAPPVKGDGLQPGDHIACKTFPQVRPKVR